MRKRVINVLEKGADPTGASDCTAAFREALEDATASGVIVPLGTYKISGMIKGQAAHTEPLPVAGASAAGEQRQLIGEASTALHGAAVQ